MLIMKIISIIIVIFQSYVVNTISRDSRRVVNTISTDRMLVGNYAHIATHGGSVKLGPSTKFLPTLVTPTRLVGR